MTVKTIVIVFIGTVTLTGYLQYQSLFVDIDNITP